MVEQRGRVVGEAEGAGQGRAFRLLTGDIGDRLGAGGVRLSVRGRDAEQALCDLPRAAAEQLHRRCGCRLEPRR